MYSWNEIREQVNAFIDAIKFERKPFGLYEPIRYTISQGGKRVRPVLFLMAYNMYKDSIGEAFYPAVALETYHNHTLIHDDVMDNASLRRGMPTVRAKWNDTMAILSGDSMLLLAYEFLSHVPAEKLPVMLAGFGEMAKEICEGQLYDIEFETRENVTEQEYIEMIRLKTSVLLASSLRLGAYLAGAPEEDQDSLYAYGEKMGIAFQLQDDYLDVYADEALFGKKIGGDICCNKKTFLLITAMNLASPQQFRDMKEWMEKSEFNAEEKIAFFTRIYDELGVKEICRQRIEALFEECDKYMAQVSVAPERKLPLKELAASLLDRNL